jgi:hypothetical protein
MTAYRAEACAFCELASEGRCPRCQVAVCASHGPVGQAWCALCAKELKDDLDVAGFSIAVNDVPPDSGGMFRSRQHPLVAIIDSVVRWIRTSSSAKRVRHAFDTRTPAEIAAWRRTAGVRVRGQA